MKQIKFTEEDKRLIRNATYWLYGEGREKIENERR